MYERISYQEFTAYSFSVLHSRTLISSQHFFCIANSSVRCMSQIMKLCRVLLSNRRIKKHQNSNTNSGFFEAMHFAVKFHYIYFVIFHYLLPKNCGALVVITLFNIYISSNEGKKLLYVPYGSRLMFLSHKCFIAFSYL